MQENERNPLLSFAALQHKRKWVRVSRPAKVTVHAECPFTVAPNKKLALFSASRTFFQKSGKGFHQTRSRSSIIDI